MQSSNRSDLAPKSNIFPRVIAGIGVLLLAATVTAFAPGEAPEATTEGAALHGQWQIRATGARIIGGYGDNFAYNGENIRPLDGHAEVTLNTAEGTGEIIVEVETTSQSGPIRFSEDQSFDGEIRIVQRLNAEQMDMARVEQDIWLHGDTGNEAPVMPELFNYFATWGPATISVDGEEVVPMIGSHTMFSEQARGADGKITRNGQVYSPMVSDKEGFTNPQETEFHVVAHTTQPDQDNFPPHAAWIHLHFSDVEVLQKPGGAPIPYTDAE